MVHSFRALESMSLSVCLMKEFTFAPTKLNSVTGFHKAQGVTQIEDQRA